MLEHGNKWYEVTKPQQDGNKNQNETRQPIKPFVRQAEQWKFWVNPFVIHVMRRKVGLESLLPTIWKKYLKVYKAAFLF